MSERETYEFIKRDIKHAIESIRTKSPEAAEYLGKHLVMDDIKMTFAYTGGDGLKIEPVMETFTPGEQALLLALLPHLRRN